MRGIADGAKLTIEDIIALNVRTEIAFGLFKDGKDADGCTSLAYVPPSGGSTLLGQTWDWLKPQTKFGASSYFSKQWQASDAFHN